MKLPFISRIIEFLADLFRSGTAKERHNMYETFLSVNVKDESEEGFREVFYSRADLGLFYEANRTHVLSDRGTTKNCLKHRLFC